MIKITYIETVATTSNLLFYVVHYDNSFYGCVTDNDINLKNKEYNRIWYK